MLETCASYTKLNTCIDLGSGVNRQITEGFGNLLIQYRTNCKNGGVCKGLVEPWFPRDSCIWCLDSGSKTGGQCRPGNSYGICPTVQPEAKALFSLFIKSTCGPDTICLLANAYPDLGIVLNVPTPSPTSTSPTPPTTTFSPTSKVKCHAVRSKAKCVVASGCHWVANSCKPQPN